MSESPESAPHSRPPAGAADKQPERLYRAIGIQAVAAAAAQLRRGEKQAEPAERDLPAFLRDEIRAA
jgi:hypothetical protein